MLNKLLSFNRKNKLMQSGDRIICALSGGADSVALLCALYLLKEKLHIALAAAHFNHGLRGPESDPMKHSSVIFAAATIFPFSLDLGK